MMKTDELIHELSRDLRPVQRLPPPGRRAAIWLLCGAVYVAGVVTIGWLRHGRLGIDGAAPYVLQQLALAVTAVLGALSAFASVIPGRSSRAKLALVLPLIVMMAALAWGVLRDLEETGTAGFWRETDWSCVVSTTLGGAVLWGLAGVMLRRGAILEPGATAVFAAIAAVSLANIEACVTRVHAFTATVIVWHGATAALLLVTSLTLGSIVLARHRVSRPS